MEVKHLNYEFCSSSSSDVFVFQGVDQPITDLKRAMKEHRLDKNDFVTLEEDLMTTIDYAEKEEKGKN